MRARVNGAAPRRRGRETTSRKRSRAGRVPRMPRWLCQPRHGNRAWYCPFTLASGSDPRHGSRVALLEDDERRGPGQRGEGRVERGAEGERRNRERARPEPPDDAQCGDRLELEEAESRAGAELGEGPPQQRIAFAEAGAQPGERRDAVDDLKHDVGQHEREHGALTAGYHDGPFLPRRTPCTRRADPRHMCRAATDAPSSGFAVRDARAPARASVTRGSPGRAPGDVIHAPFDIRRGDRVVEGARLLSVCRGSTPTEGSNPSLSAPRRRL